MRRLLVLLTLICKLGLLQAQLQFDEEGMMIPPLPIHNTGSQGQLESLQPLADCDLRYSVPYSATLCRCNLGLYSSSDPDSKFIEDIDVTADTCVQPVCSDPHATTSMNGDTKNCYCNEGYISKETGALLLVNDQDECEESLASWNLVEEYNSITLKSKTISSLSNMGLARHSIDDPVVIQNIHYLRTTGTECVSDSTNDCYSHSFQQLEPGRRYHISFAFTADAPDNSGSMDFPAVTACSCTVPPETDDKSGKPTDLTIFQEQGYVTFEFRDNSRCEEAYSFTRNPGVSFTRDYFFIGPNPCYEVVDPGTEVRSFR